MGCACVKSDAVIKNQRITSMNSDLSGSKKERVYNQSELRSGSMSNPNVINNSNAIPQNPRNSSVNPRGSPNIRGSSGNNVNRLQSQANRLASGVSTNFITGAMPYLPSNNDPNFNMPEIPDDYVGSGLKRMKAYISPVSIEDLEKKRLAFWGTRVEGNQETWEFLQMICSSKEIEEGFIKEYLNAAGVTPCSNCINLTYDTRGYYYEIPNYCINDPYKYEIRDESDKLRPKENMIGVIVRKIVEEKKFDIMNTQTIQDLKKIISEQFEQEPIDTARIRLFFGGKELVDTKELWVYNIEDCSIVILLIRPID